MSHKADHQLIEEAVKIKTVKERAFNTAERIGWMFETIILNKLNKWDIVKNEVPEGIINGANSLFITKYEFYPDSLDVYSNGLKLKVVSDYNFSGRTIQLVFSPVVGETIVINYIKN